MAEGRQGLGKMSHMSAVARGYLVDGEVIHWQGKPATIFIIGRGVLLTVLALAFVVSLLAGGWDVTAVAMALLACVLMMVVDNRYGLIVGVAGIAITVIAFLLGGGEARTWLVMGPLAYSLIYLLANIIYLGRVLFMITNQRIVTRYGIFSLRYAELDIDRIQNVTVIQPWYERILGYGDLYYATAGEKGGIDYERPGLKLMTGGAVTWENVGRPFDVLRKVNEIILHSDTPEHRGGGVGGRSLATSAPYLSDAEERLKQLSELSTKGLISQQEYQQKREEILRKL